MPIICPHCKREINTSNLDGFDQWWTVYPRKEAKGEAKRAELLRLTVLYADHMKKRDKDFIPMPTTFLNQERWTDDGLTKGDVRPDSGTGLLAVSALPDCWAGHGEKLRAEVGAKIFDVWLRDAVFSPGLPPTLTVSTTARRDYISRKLGAALRRQYGELLITVGPR